MHTHILIYSGSPFISICWKQPQHMYLHLVAITLVTRRPWKQGNVSSLKYLKRNSTLSQMWARDSFNFTHVWAQWLGESWCAPLVIWNVFVSLLLSRVKPRDLQITHHQRGYDLSLTGKLSRAPFSLLISVTLWLDNMTVTANALWENIIEGSKTFSKFDNLFPDKWSLSHCLLVAYKGTFTPSLSLRK